MTIEQKVKQYLEDKLHIPTRLQYPEELPDTFIVIQRTGGNEENFISHASLSIASIAPSLYEAMEMDHKVLLAMRTIADGITITGCRYNGGGNWTDPTSGQYRYRSYYEINYYEEDL